MKNHLIIFCLASIVFLNSACSTTSANKPLIVNEENYPLVETHRQMGITQTKAGGVNRFDHKRAVPSVEQQPVIRMNRDTLYSMAIVDAASGASVSIPETNGRYISLMYLDENHRVYDMVYEPGKHEIPAHTNHMYALVRIGVRSGDTNDMAEIHKLQDQIKLEATSSTPFEPVAFDEASYEKTHHGILKQFAESGLRDTEKMFGTEDYVDPDRYLMGTAIGWGGATWKDNIYQFSTFFEGFEGRSTTFKDPQNTGGFWSITVYDKDGFMFHEVANVNSETAIQNPDGTYTVHFGCEGKVNNIPIENKTGSWNAAMRHYTPSKAVSDGKIKPMETIVLSK